MAQPLQLRLPPPPEAVILGLLLEFLTTRPRPKRYRGAHRR